MEAGDIVYVENDRSAVLLAPGGIVVQQYLIGRSESVAVVTVLLDDTGEVKTYAAKNVKPMEFVTSQKW